MSLLSDPQQLQAHVPYLFGSSHQVDRLTSGVIELFKEGSTDVKYTGSSLLLRSIPACMIPGEILRFFGACLKTIKHIKILRHYSDPDSYLAVIDMDSSNDTIKLIRDYSGRMLSSLEQITCELLPIEKITCSNCDGHTGVCPSSGNSSSSSDNSTTLKGLLSNSHDSEENRAASPHKQRGTVSGLTEEDMCPLCLEPFEPGGNFKAFTSCCEHTFHTACIIKMPGSQSQCPVCRFQHDSLQSNLTCCFTCGWSGGNGADNGSNGNNVTPSLGINRGTRLNSGMEGQRSVRNFRANNDDSILRRSSTNNADSFTHGAGLNEVSSTTPSAIHTECDDIWVCLICGFTGCGLSNSAHIYAHYEETLHTYALNTATKQVWDFAGDGFVHRLILNSNQAAIGIDTDDGRADNTAEQIARQHLITSSSMPVDLPATSSTRSAAPAPPLPVTTKVVEVCGNRSSMEWNDTSTDMDTAYEHRSSSSSGMARSADRAPLNDEQEERVISAKLENMAFVFNRMLVNQMEQNRRLFETRLHRIRDSVAKHQEAKEEEEEAAAAESRSPSKLMHSGLSTDEVLQKPAFTPGGDISSNSFIQQAPSQRQQKNWREILKSSLESELSKLSKQCDTARSRKSRADKELEALKQINKSLLLNQEEWSCRVDKAARGLKEAQDCSNRAIPLLEKQVAALMAKLDNSSSSIHNGAFSTGSEPVDGGRSGSTIRKASSSPIGVERKQSSAASCESDIEEDNS